MSNPEISAAQREEWKRLADEATPGPWELCPYDRGNPKIGLAPSRWTWVNEIQIGAAGRLTIPDAQFVAASRTAVPALLRALEVVEKERDHNREVIEIYVKLYGELQAVG